MDIQTLLFTKKIGTWVQDNVTAFGAVGRATVPIGNVLPTNIGFIYGLSTYADGVDADNLALPSTVNMQNIFVTLQDGSTQFLQQQRMSDLLTEFAGTPIVRNERYMPVAIPYFDLSKSFFNNPTLIVSVQVHIRMWYVDNVTWANLSNTFTFDDIRPLK